MDLRASCPLTTADALRRAVAIAPDVEALVAPDGRRTYAELDSDVVTIAAALEAQGVRHGDHVGLCMGNSHRWVSTFLAIASIGAVTVPINTRFVGPELAYALKQARISTLIISDRVLKVDFIAMLRSICPAIDTRLPDAEFPDLKRVIVSGKDVPAGAWSWNAFMSGAAGPVTIACKPDDILLIQYTSGTTSFPKGVMLPHKNMLANGFFSGARMGFRVADRFHTARPFFHVAGSSLSVLSGIQHVITLVTMDRFEPGEALRMMEEERCSHFSGNDTMALMLLNHPDLPKRKLVVRGAWLAAASTVVRRVIDELGARECVAGYGLSEASPNVAQSCWWEPEEVRASARMRPQPGVSIAIRRDGRDCAPGEPGEIFVRGWSVMKGYFDKPKETAAAVDADGWLATGDLGDIDAEGRLLFLGRAKDIVRVGGENVAPADVENVLHGHTKIKQAAVVGVPDNRLTEVVAAFVLLNDGCTCESAEIIDWSKSRMAGFKVPRHVWIVKDFESLGMTASAKIQKKPLAEHARKLLGL